MDVSQKYKRTEKGVACIECAMKWDGRGCGRKMLQHARVKHNEKIKRVGDVYHEEKLPVKDAL